MIDMRAKFVAVSLYTVATEKLSAVADAARGAMEGLVSKAAWVHAQWEPAIGTALASLVADATAFNVRTFVPVTVVRPR